MAARPRPRVLPAVPRHRAVPARKREQGAPVWLNRRRRAVRRGREPRARRAAVEARSQRRAGHDAHGARSVAAVHQGVEPRDLRHGLLARGGHGPGVPGRRPPVPFGLGVHRARRVDARGVPRQRPQGGDRGRQWLLGGDIGSFRGRQWPLGRRLSPV